MEGNEIRIEAINPLPIEKDSGDGPEKPTNKILPKDGRKVLPFKKPQKDSKKGS